MYTTVVHCCATSYFPNNYITDSGRVKLENTAAPRTSPRAAGPAALSTFFSKQLFRLFDGFELLSPPSLVFDHH